jgi:methyl-accepting chemotaxis protein
MDLDFTKARLQHNTWRLRLRQYLEGDEEMNRDEAVSPYECALGKWLYSDGLRKHGNWPEMANLESAHAQMHNVVERMVGLKESGNDAEARMEYEKVLPLSQTVVSLLEQLERQVNSIAPGSTDRLNG